MDALFAPDEEEEGGGEYDVLKVWEVQLMMKLCDGDEEKYSTIPVMTRARFICADKLSDWVSSLDMRERMKKPINAHQTHSPSQYPSDGE